MTRRKRDVSRLTGLLTVAADAGQAAPSATLPVGALRPGHGQPRREFDAAKLEGLAQSIREQGVLQPLLVRPVDGGHEIVAGERRWRAAQLAGLDEVPVLVREMSQREAQQVALIENLQREDLNTVDEVDAKLELLAVTLGLTREGARGRVMQLLREPPGEDHRAVEALFETLGESWTYFAKNKLRILHWPAPVLEAVRGGLPFTLGAVIATAPPEHQTGLIEQAHAGASREALRAAIRAIQPRPTAGQGGRAHQVARVLGSARWYEGLAPGDQTAVNAWLAKMPQAVKKALKP